MDMRKHNLLTNENVLYYSTNARGRQDSYHYYGLLQKGIRHKWIMRAERAGYGATEPIVHPTVIITPGVTWSYWDELGQDARGN